MNEIQIVSLADLLLRSRPVTGTASLRPSAAAPSPPPPKKHKSHHHSTADHSPNSQPFTPLSHPSILIGTVSLPSDDFTHCPGHKSHCLSFSDGSSTICCAFLDFDLDVIGRTIHILAWNFVPFKNVSSSSSGVLEVIRWSHPHQRSLLSVPGEECSTSSSRALSGELRAVSPVFQVPCRNLGDATDSVGFLAELTTSSGDDGHGHSLEKDALVYFVGVSSCWRPALAMLVGKLVTVSWLKKKLVFVGGEESYVMFVTTSKTMVSSCDLRISRMDIGKTVHEVKGDGCVYIGVVTGVYMQGRAVELDEDVWLLIIDPLLAPQHSLRVGAIISVRNFYSVCPRYSWMKMLLFGTCSRTCIVIRAFSLSDSRCHSRIQNQSLLGKFIKSQTFAAQFWILLLISCFTRKFNKILSDKDILGSKNKEGLVQRFASSSLASYVSQHRHGVFLDFCKHDQFSCSNRSTLAPLKLVIPIINFIIKCETIWMSIMSQEWNDAETGQSTDDNHWFCEEASSCHIIRRIISSEDLGFILMGTLKISPSGRLQLVDETGSIDVVIPDLPSDLSGQMIHEVKDYKLVIEGFPKQLVPLRLDYKKRLSCKNIFQQLHYKKDVNQVAFYVHFYLNDSDYLDVSPNLRSCKVRTSGLKRCSGESFHLLFVAHKFPHNEKDDLNSSNTPSLFAEALILPYDVVLIDDHEHTGFKDVFQSMLKKKAGYSEKRQVQKREWSDAVLKISSQFPFSISDSNPEVAKRNSSQIPCLITFRSTDAGEPAALAYLCHTVSVISEKTVSDHWARRILLEFKSDNFDKYQLLQLGEYYILRCPSLGLKCNTEGCETLNYGKALVESQTTLWKLSFSYGNPEHQEYRRPYVACPDRVNMHACGISGQSELLLHHSLNKMHEASDVHLRFPSEITGSLKEEVEAILDGLTRPFPPTSEILSVSSCIQMMGELVRPLTAVDPQSNLPQGNLISLRGEINKVHYHDCESKAYLNSDHANVSQRRRTDICIHVCDDDHMVRICGNFTKFTHLLGLGPGANATFQRVLVTRDWSGCCKLWITAVSYVLINSLKESGHQHREKRFLLPLTYNILTEESFNMVPLALNSQLGKCKENMEIRLRCRVRAANIIVFEKQSEECVRLHLRKQPKKLLMKIPLAGFILDDGSSLYCCWANASRAASLLGLDEAVNKHCIDTCKGLKRKVGKHVHDDIGYYLEKFLRKYHRVVVKNHGAVNDSSCQDFTFSVVSDEVFTNSEEALLRLIVLNASCGPILNIVGYKMDSNALQWLDMQLAELQVVMPSMQNICIREVGHVNPLQEARNVLQELVST